MLSPIIRSTWLYLQYLVVFFGATAPQWARASSFTKFLDHTQRRTPGGRTPLDEWSARRRDLYLTHNTHNKQISMPPVGFEPTISAGERPQTYALDSAATGIGVFGSIHPSWCRLVSWLRWNCVSIVRSTWLYLQYLVVFTQVTVGWCLGWVETQPRHQPAATSVNNTRYCKYSQVLLIMGENIARNM